MTPSHYIWCRGVRFPADWSLLTPKRRKSLRNGRYEASELKALLSVARTEDRVLELGGGIGFLSAALARKVGCQTIITIEPDPLVYAYMRRVHQANEVTHITTIQAAVSDMAAPRARFLARAEFVASSLIRGPGPDIVRECDVEVLALRDLLAQHHPTLLICDVEGMEARLLRNADLTGVRAVVVELHLGKIGLDGERAIIENLRAQGLMLCPEHSRGNVSVFLRADD